MRRLFIPAVASLCLLGACGPSSKPVFNNAKPITVRRNEIKAYYQKAKVLGCFVLYDDSAKTYTICNDSMLNQAFSPASTFKICNSLIGLETGVIPNADFVLKWNGVKNRNPNWNHDQDMAEAIKNSTVWYYQELARRVGGKQMKYWLDKVPYGNADTSGGIDQFWLHGGLRITPMQQIEFLKRLHDNTLPFSHRSMNIVKDILILGDSTGIVLRGKTGWAVREKEKDQTGWFVGYVEKKGKVFYFANCIYSRDLDNPDFVSARREIALQTLRDLNVLE